MLGAVRAALRKDDRKASWVMGQEAMTYGNEEAESERTRDLPEVPMRQIRALGPDELNANLICLF